MSAYDDRRGSGAQVRAPRAPAPEHRPRPSSRECLDRVRAGLRKHETDRVTAVRRHEVASAPAPALSSAAPAAAEAAVPPG